MEARRGEIVMSLVLLAVLGTALVWSLSYSPETGALPQLVSGISAAATVVYLIGLVFGGRHDLPVERSPSRSEEVEQKLDATVVRQQPVGSLATGLLLPVIYLAAYLALGIVPAVFLFIAGYAWWFGKVRWYKAILAGGAVAAIVYLLFVYVFVSPLYHGLLS